MFRKSVLQFAVTVILSTASVYSPLFLYGNELKTEASPSEPAESSPKESADKTASTGDAEKREWRETPQGFMYLINGEYVTGWNMIDNAWYYFGADSLMKTDTNIGIYTLGADGKLINGDGSVPLPHGEIHNTSTGGVYADNTDNVTETENSINSLCNCYIASEVLSTDDIIKARYRYNSLTLSEKARVHNEYMLADMENHYGITYDYSVMKNDDNIYGDDVEGNDYTFELNRSVSSLTVIVRFSSHDDGAENPEINLITPTGSSTVLERNTSQIRNQSMNLYLTWTDTYLQIDIAHGEYGTWSVRTDNKCSFATKEYAGSRNEIHAIPEDVVASKTEPDRNGEDIISEKDHTRLKSILSLILLAIMLVGYALLRVMLNRRQFDNEKKNKRNAKQKVKKNEHRLSYKTVSSSGASYDEYLAIKAELQAEYDSFEKADNSYGQEETTEMGTENPTDGDTEKIYAVEVTSSVEQFDESYIDDNSYDWE